MRFSEAWLREWVDPPLTREALAAQLTMAGLEVDAVEPVAPAFSNVVVGAVTAVEPHPQADRLRVCRVDIGEKHPLTIVCGANNVAVGMKAPTALVGARLPEGLVIKKSKLRGVESFGMLCSARELGLADEAEGLMVLPSDCEPGTNVRDLLDLDDVAIEIGLTPNRSDCLGVAGIAREVAALNCIDLRDRHEASVAPQHDRAFPVEVRAAKACPRYLGRIITGIDTEAETPLWMQERLRRSGLRSISPTVDVTNYVLLELGQPMHAFDLDRLDRGIVVRFAESGERLTLLDGQEIELQGETLVIADHSGPVALAGIMGGAASAVGAETRDLFLESAFFTPEAIVGKARGYALHTDSSHRFERGVDPELARKAMERATVLLLDIVGGSAGPVIEACDPRHLPARSPVTLRAARLRRLLGTDIPEAQVTDILQRLGLEITAQGGGRWEVLVPSFRFDIAIEADLIEEIARVYGYAELPTTRPQARLRIDADSGWGDEEGGVRQLLVDLGYQEAITYSFVDPGLQSLLDPAYPPIRLANPISTDTAVMRTSLWPGLVQAARYNLNRQQRRVRLFEVGAKYLDQGAGIDEPVAIGAIACGGRYPEQWGVPEQPVDFFDLKHDLESLLALVYGADRFQFVVERHPALHPGQSARVLDGRMQAIGWIGALHPEVAAGLDMPADVFVFELQLPSRPVRSVPTFQPLSKFPAVRRDLAIIIDAQVPAQAVYDKISSVAGGVLQDLVLFDLYCGKGVETGKKSLALGLTLQEFSRTLTDKEIDALIDRILKDLHSSFAATLRV